MPELEEKLQTAEATIGELEAQLDALTDMLAHSEWRAMQLERELAGYAAPLWERRN